MTNGYHSGLCCFRETGEEWEEDPRFRETDSCKNPRAEDSTLEGRAKKSRTLMEGCRAGWQRLGGAEMLGSEVLAD